MSNMHTHLDAARKSDLAQDPAEPPRRAHPVQTADPVLRALSAAEAAFNHYAAHHLRQAGKPGEDAAKRRQQAAENADLAQAMREGIVANYARHYQVPQGWKLVPCEPTREMLDKARENLVRDGEIDPMLKSAYAAMLAATPKLVTTQAAQSPVVQAERQPRTDAEIVAQTEELAAKLNQWRWGGRLTDGSTYRDSASPKAQSCWAMACVIQGLLTDTDPENAVAEVDGAQGAERWRGMKNNKTPQTALFCDCETDAKRAEFFACGRAVETGIVAPAIAQQIADAYGRAAELLEALVRIMDNECPIRGASNKALVEHWEFEKSEGRGCADDMLFALAAIAKATGQQGGAA